ncbi:hypothetical protein CONPUDRAFT_126688 [Coniophora puteana RWD-64-598 SS2]|uniref:Oxidase ustYa n=1 Tax=Coniophora puteana (strain RWD-64-598) TaxID=741705 RepID=A0A5M3MIT5_CONPW|nr:uncharacterized protein CONPUDRAFT_126688 [Coniophora puteana RWD-64-598 SS2]EIW78936.1 hypothetical protein CONPUDRAFT_126688 [Coniophora puteana RWD-64-598 SS2]
MTRPWEHKSRTFYLLTFFVMTAVHVAFTIHTGSVLDKALPTPRTYTWIDNDFPDQLPIDMPPVALEMVDGEDHFGLYNDEEWSTLFPNDGFLTLGPPNRIFMVSMIHQFHCLDIIRVGMVANRTGSMHHVEHCLRYLRQTILCNSDVTLEVGRPRFADGTWRHTTDGGSGMVHRCKDWRAVRDFLIDNPPVEIEQVWGYGGEAKNGTDMGYY